MTAWSLFFQLVKLICFLTKMNFKIFGCWGENHILEEFIIERCYTAKFFLLESLIEIKGLLDEIKCWNRLIYQRVNSMPYHFGNSIMANFSGPAAFSLL